MRPRIWGVPLVILALLAGISLGMRQTGWQWPWLLAHPRVALRADLGSEARLGSPVDAGATPVQAGAGPNGGGTPVEGEVIPLGERGRAILTGRSGVLVVTGDGGRELLRAEGVEGWYSWQSAGTTMIWLRYAGGSRRNRVFRYDAGPDRFVAVDWGGQGPEHTGSLTFSSNGNLLQEAVSVDPHHTRMVTWHYAGAGRLESAPGAFLLSEPAWYPAGADSLLIAFLESVGMRLPEEARRYFIDPGQADSYYRILSSQVLTYGRAHVLLGDALDPTKKEFPFFLDMEGPFPGENYFYLSLEGSVVLLPTADGKRLQMTDFRYSVVPEPVDRLRAAALVRALPEARGLASLSAGTTHGWARWAVAFDNGGPVYEVDSRNGDIYRIEKDGRKVRVSPAGLGP